MNYTLYYIRKELYKIRDTTKFYNNFRKLRALVANYLKWVND